MLIYLHLKKILCEYIIHPGKHSTYILLFFRFSLSTIDEHRPAAFMSCIWRCGGLCPNLVDYHRRYIHKSFKAIAAEGPRGGRSEPWFDTIRLPLIGRVIVLGTISRIVTMYTNIVHGSWVTAMCLPQCIHEILPYLHNYPWRSVLNPVRTESVDNSVLTRFR